ncbi:MAG: hypothetical protein L0Z53_24670 [Acidobacteriales bacterium]|nr:hypothetical protein [Terriglobales bacterium]
MATKETVPTEQVDLRESVSGGERLAAATFGVSMIQSLCVWFMAIGAVKVAFGLGALGAAGAASFVHSDPVRITLMVAAVLGATATLFVIWNQLRLRNLPTAQWRKRPLTSRERRRIAIAVSASVLSYIFVIAELFAHRYLHL